MGRKSNSRSRSSRPLMFSDRCRMCDTYLLPREFGTEGGRYSMPPGWLSANLRPDPIAGGHVLHASCAEKVEPPPPPLTPADLLLRVLWGESRSRQLSQRR